MQFPEASSAGHLLAPHPLANSSSQGRTLCWQQAGSHPAAVDSDPCATIAAVTHMILCLKPATHHIAVHRLHVFADVTTP